MKKFGFALLALLLVSLATGCKKADVNNPKQSEIAISLKEVGDNVAVINCVYDPDKSEMYQLSLNETTFLNNRVKSGTFRIDNLQSGRDYKVVAKSYDADCNLVDMSEVNFKTTGVIMDMGISIGTSIWDEEEYKKCPIQVSVKKMTDETAKVMCEFTASDLAASYSLECINFFKGTSEGTFSETGTFGVGTKEFLLSGLHSDLESFYTIYAYYHGADGRRTGKYASFDFSLCFR